MLILQFPSRKPYAYEKSLRSLPRLLSVNWLDQSPSFVTSTIVGLLEKFLELCAAEIARSLLL